MIQEMTLQEVEALLEGKRDDDVIKGVVRLP